MKPVITSVTKMWRKPAAFTRIDLLAVLFALAILAIPLLPALARTRVATQGTQCLSNLRQLITGWTMYASDNNGLVTPNRGLFPPNPDYYPPPPGVSNHARWVGGSMAGGSVGGIYGSELDATNAALLTNSTYTALAPYVKDPATYRCPADRSTWDGVPRVRSYSMNCAFGPAFNGTRQDPGHRAIGHWLAGSGATGPGPWRTYIQESDMVAPPPSQLWVLLDEHPNSINDAEFEFEMPINPTQTHYIDIPAKYHNNGCNFAFADGHVKAHQWRDPNVIPPVIWAADTASGFGTVVQGTPNNPDILWMAHRTTAPLPGAPSYLYYPGP